MNKIFLMFCLLVGLAQSLDLSDTTAVNNAVANVCNAITARPSAAAIVLGRVEKMLDKRQQEVQQRLPHTFVYITKQENKDQIKAGGVNCKNFFDALKGPLSMDLQNNEELRQYIQQALDERIKEFIGAIQRQSA